MKKNTILNWSGGKDATFALHLLSQKPDIEIKALLTSINSKRKRITMHGVPLRLLQEQVKSLNRHLELIELPENISMEKYSDIILKNASQHFVDGISYYAFGDIFLEDLRHFRDQELQKSKIKTLYPLWKKNTHELALDFINLGYKAIVVAANSKKLSSSFAGRYFDQQFILDLPEDIDPCGENGEFHTFVYDGPLFQYPIEFTKGETTLHQYKPSDDSKSQWDNGVWFCDIQPKT
jgi:uncharacterized protein (TIGR00290 family)